MAFAIRVGSGSAIRMRASRMDLCMMEGRHAVGLNGAEDAFSGQPRR